MARYYPKRSLTPWTVAHQTPLPMEIFRQEYWSGLPFPTPGELPDPGTKPVSLASSALASGFFTTEPLKKPKKKNSTILISKGEQWVVLKKGLPGISMSRYLYLEFCSTLILTRLRKYDSLFLLNENVFERQVWSYSYDMLIWEGSGYLFKGHFTYVYSTTREVFRYLVTTLLRNPQGCLTLAYWHLGQNKR